MLRPVCRSAKDGQEAIKRVLQRSDLGDGRHRAFWHALGAVRGSKGLADEIPNMPCTVTVTKMKEEGEDQPQQEPSETPPIKDPLNLLGGLMKGSLKDKEGKDDGVWTATKHQVVEVSQQTHEKDSSNAVEKKDEELDQSVTNHRVVEMPGQKQESGEEQVRVCIR